jgi:hypothetical protein
MCKIFAHVGIGVCTGNGDVTFQSAVLYLVNDSGSGLGNAVLVLGDFNGDGILDVATPGKIPTRRFGDKCIGRRSHIDAKRAWPDFPITYGLFLHIPRLETGASVLA